MNIYTLLPHVFSEKVFKLASTAAAFDGDLPRILHHCLVYHSKDEG